MLEGLAELGEQRLTVGGILLGLDRVAADDVTARAEPDLLDLEFVPAQGQYQINPNAQLRPRLARIYSFSFEGHYYKLPRPLVYLVWGNGIPPEEPSDLTGGAQRRWIGPTGARFGLPAGGGKEKGWSTFEAGNTGIEGKGWRFASDILVWTLDGEDMSMCIDIDVGTLDQILLGASLDFEAGMADTSLGRRTCFARVASFRLGTGIGRRPGIGGGACFGGVPCLDAGGPPGRLKPSDLRGLVVGY